MDVNQRAKRIVDLATRQSTEPKRKGRQLSGQARAEALTAKRRREIAKKAASARWSKARPKIRS